MNRPMFVLLLAALAGCAGGPSASEPSPEPPAEAPPAAAAPPQPGRVRFEASQRLKLEPVVEESVPSQIQVAGRVTLQEDRTARVGSFVEGLVESCCKSVGTYVKQGEVLARLHSHAIHEVVAEVATTRANLDTRTAELEYARQAQARAQKLLDLKAGSLQAVQQAETVLRQAENALIAAKADVERASAHLEFYGLNPDEIGETGPDGHPSHPMIDIVAPMAGRIVSRTVRLGDVVTPSSELYVISDLSQLWVIAQVPEEHMAEIEPGMTVSVETRAFPGRPFPGRVTLIGTELDPESMTVQVRCVVPNPQGLLKTGMYATVTLRSQSGRPALTVSSGALQNMGDQPVVFVAVGDGEYQVRPVTVGPTVGDRVALLSGVHAGEQLVVDGAFLLKTELLRDDLVGGEE
ncbi:MAG: efflux RND transporter periplasmic adaptor subunit [Acidobacteria bacterium]|nr:efflux RND transporter periplasmic adaptor subunit [Acidobacteriota bacterium]